jgi:hypothetical protein
VFLLNSRLGNFRCGLYRNCTGNPSPEVTGSFFAEFLPQLSPVGLGILYQPTCVGLRYGFPPFNPTTFSRQPIHSGWEKISLRKAINPPELLGCVSVQK